MLYHSRIRTRAVGLSNGPALLDIASRDTIRREMRRRVSVGEKPVTALSSAMVEAFGVEAARNDQLRQLAGEVAAYIVETEHRCIRASGSRKIVGDQVFTSGQPFRVPPVPAPDATVNGTPDPDIGGPEFLVRCLSDGSLAMLDHFIAAERGRRAAVHPARTSEQRQQAREAATAIVEDSDSHTLGGLSIREMIEEGRR